MLCIVVNGGEQQLVADGIMPDEWFGDEADGYLVFTFVSDIRVDDFKFISFERQECFADAVGNIGYPAIELPEIAYNSGCDEKMELVGIRYIGYKFSKGVVLFSFVEVLLLQQVFVPGAFKEQLVPVFGGSGIDEFTVDEAYDLHGIKVGR